MQVFCSAPAGQVTTDLGAQQPWKSGKRKCTCRFAHLNAKLCHIFVPAYGMAVFLGAFHKSSESHG